MPNKIRKISRWAFFVISYVRSDRPYDSQQVTFLYWDSFDKNLQQYDSSIKKKILEHHSKAMKLNTHSDFIKYKFRQLTFINNVQIQEKRTELTWRCSDEHGCPGKQILLRSMFRTSLKLLSTRFCSFSRLSDLIQKDALGE